MGISVDMFLLDKEQSLVTACGWELSELLCSTQRVSVHRAVLRRTHDDMRSMDQEEHPFQYSYNNLH